MAGRITPFFAGLLAFGLAAAGAGAESPPPFPDFQAKRVTPPKPGTSKRITVQITAPPPAPKPAPGKNGKAEESAVAAVAMPSARYGWFWDTISPELAATGPGRLEPALTRLGRPPEGQGVQAPRLQQLQAIVSAQGKDILRATVGTEVSPALVLAVIAVESGGRADAVSGAGAEGLMQLMPATATRFGVTNSFAAPQNISGGVRYLDWLLKRFDRDPILALAGYNAGENSITAHDGVPPFAETRDYVPKVLVAYAVARDMCLTPPVLLSDGCVFRFN